MTVPEHTSTIADGASPAADERREPGTFNDETADPSARSEALGRDDNRQDSAEDRTGAPPLSPEVGDRVGANVDPYPAGNTVQLCLHVKEDGVYCQCPALSGRRYCYNHLRLRGQQMRMARAIAQRVPYQLVLPPLEDLNAVQAALTHVAAALTAGLLERRRAGHLVCVLQLAASNLRFMHHVQTQAARQPQANQPATAPVAADTPRVVKEYPEFEAEFGLPPGLDLSLPPQVAFPPPEKATGWSAAVQATPQRSPHPVWTKEDIQLEDLEKRRPFLSEKSYCEQASAVRDRIHKKVLTEKRHEHEAEWEAEAARRNAKEAEKAEMWRSMDVGQQRAFMQGVLTGREEAEEELDRAKKPVAKASGD